MATNENEIPIGITLPIQRGQSGYFKQSLSLIEQVKSNLINLILTRKGERVHQPEFGSDLHELLFEQMDNDEFNAAVHTAIQTDVDRWMPFLTIRNTEIVRDDNRNKVLVKVEFSFTSDETVTESIVVEF